MTNPWERGDDPELNVDFKNKIIKNWEDLRPKERDFAITEGNANNGIYQAEEIIRDLKRVKEIKESPDYVKSRTVASIVAEYALPYLIEDEQLLGNASVSISSEFDDIINGVDFVVRYPSNDDKVLYMGVDVKTIKGGKPDYRTNDSIEKSLEDARRHRLKKIKYFIDPQDDKKKYLEIPRIVIVFDSDEILKYQEILIVPMKKRPFRQKDLIEILRKKMINEMKGSCALMSGRIEDMKTSSYEPGLDKILTDYTQFIKFLEQQP